MGFSAGTFSNGYVLLRPLVEGLEGDGVGRMRCDQVGPQRLAVEVEFHAVIERVRLVTLSGAVSVDVVEMVLQFLTV